MSPDYQKNRQAAIQPGSVLGPEPAGQPGGANMLDPLLALRGTQDMSYGSPSGQQARYGTGLGKTVQGVGDVLSDPYYQRMVLGTLGRIQGPFMAVDSLVKEKAREKVIAELVKQETAKMMQQHQQAGQSAPMQGHAPMQGQSVPMQGQPGGPGTFLGNPEGIRLRAAAGGYLGLQESVQQNLEFPYNLMQTQQEMNIAGQAEERKAGMYPLEVEKAQALTEESKQRTAKSQWEMEKKPQVKYEARKAIAPDGQMRWKYVNPYNPRDYEFGDVATAPETGPPPAATIGGKRMGWNKETQTYDIDYGEVGEATTTVEALSQATTIATRIVSEKYKDKGLTDWLASALTATLAGQEIKPPETAEQQERWGEYLTILEDTVATNFPEHVASLGAFISRMRDMGAGTKLTAPSLEEMRKNPARYKEGEIDGQLSFRDIETNTIHIVPTR